MNKISEMPQTTASLVKDDLVMLSITFDSITDALVNGGKSDESIQKMIERGIFFLETLKKDLQEK